MVSGNAAGRIACGIDEAGRGPVIGPMVISLVCADIDVLRSLNVKDSKALTRNSREALYDKIMKNATKVQHTIITAQELNDRMNVKTLNEIELEAAVRLAALCENEVVVDCFDVNEGRASHRMSAATGKKVRCIHKADRDYPAVSAASIISKVIRDREIDKIKEKYGNVGSGYPADPVTRDFIENAFRENRNLEGIIRTHWETVRKIEKKARTSRLY